MRKFMVQFNKICMFVLFGFLAFLLPVRAEMDNIQSLQNEILASSSEFNAIWKAAQNNPEADFMKELAFYLVDSYKEAKTESHHRIFAVIEKSLKSGDNSIKESVYNFLEDLQNISSHESFGMKVFEQWLGPESQEFWNDIVKNWAGISSLADIVRVEQGKKATGEYISPSTVDDPELKRMVRIGYRKQ